MKKLNFKWLWTDSHEKQSPQRFGRYAAMLIMLLTLGVGQMWAGYQEGKWGFWADGGLVLTWSKNGSSATTTINHGAIASGGSLGTITTSLNLTNTQVKFWREEHYGNVCSATVYWKLYKGSTKVDEGDYSPATWGSWSGSNGSLSYSTSQNFLDKTTGPGDYTLRVYAELKGAGSNDYYDDASYKGCGTSCWYNKDNSTYYSITFTIPSKNLTVAGAGDGNTVSGSVTGITKGTAYTITATPTAGYAFNGWTKTSGGTSITIADASSATTTVTFNNYSNDATVTASFVEEETHDITVSYVNNNSQTIKNSTTESAVGVSTTRSVTAPAINDHTWASWTVGTGVKNNSANTTTNPISINSKASGAYTLQANYTLVKCTLCIGSTSTFAADGTPYNMSYDPDVDAYYYDLASSPANLYFRFKHATGTKYWSSSWNGSYPNVYDAEANGSKITCTDISNYDNKSSIHFPGITGSPIRIWFDFQNKQAWVTETTYSVSVASENTNRGTVNKSSVTAGRNTASASFTATPVSNSGWMFKQWSATSPASLVSSATTNPNTVKATSTGGSVQAQFKHRYILRGSTNADNSELGGMAGWGATDNSAYASATISDGVMTITANLTKAKTKYKFKIYDLSGSSWKGQTETTDIPDNTSRTLSGSNNVTLTTTAAGTYTFVYTVSSNSIKVLFPSPVYSVTYGVQSGTGTVTAKIGTESIGASPGKAVGGANVVMTASDGTGYQFSKWVNESGTQISTSNPYTISSIAANCTIKAVFTARNYTTANNLKEADGTANGQYNVTYDNTSIAHTSAPSRSGYTIEGYYKEAGWSNKIANTNLSLVTSTAYTASGTNKWNQTSAPDLYLKWTQTLTLAGNGAGSTNGSITTTYYSTSTSGHTAATRTGYTLNGYYTATSGGYKVINNNGTLVSYNSNISSYLKNSSGEWIYDGTPTLSAQWTAKNYTLTFAPNGGTVDPTSASVTYDAAISNAPVPTKTGYNFTGYNTAGGTSITTNAGVFKASVSDYTDASTNWVHDGNATITAQWSPKTYTITLTQSGETGYGSAGTTSVTATYDAALPTIASLPTGATGYKFMGYYTDHNGAGTQWYDADGIKKVASYTTDGGTTLYAYFKKAEITSLEHPASIATGDVITLDVNPTIDPASGVSGYLAICWSLLYDNDNPVESGVSVASHTEGGSKPNQVRFTLTGLSSGYYKVKAVLKASASFGFDPCSTGTELSTIKSDLRIAGNSSVTILYQDGDGNTIAASSSVEVARGDSIGVKAPTIVGYSFDEWELGDVLSSSCKNAATCGLDKDSINIKAEYDGILIAKYNRKNTIYFKNTLNWPAVYVNLLTEGYWDSKGSGNENKSNRNLPMTRIGTSDVWYYEYDNKTTSAYVSFTSISQTNAKNFWGADTDVEDNKAKVVYPTRPNGDASEKTPLGFNVNTPMFVPLAGQTAVEMNKSGGGSAFYYNRGYWAKYEPVSKETGYTLKIFNKKLSSDTPDASSAPVVVKSIPFTFSGDMTFPVSVTVDLEAGRRYGFKLYRDKGNSNDAGSWYSNANNMSNKHSGDEGETVWEFKSGVNNNCGLQTTSSGDYTFTLTYGKEASTDSARYLIGVHYPEASGDYRVVFSDDDRSNILSTTIPNDSETDTISFFINKDRNPILQLQKCTVTYSGGEVTTVTWNNIGSNLIAELPSAITKNGVYYFCINRNAEGGKELGDTKLYEGNFYIRTDGAGTSKWDNYRSNDHLMAYSDYADKHENFTHSWTQWYDLTNRKNLKFTVANDYSVSITDTLTRETASGTWTYIADYIDEKGDLNRQANVRFMYNEKTNEISRAYIDGAYAAGGSFLTILARTQDSIYAAAEGGAPMTSFTFTDDGNWIYEKTVYAQPGAKYKLKSSYGTNDGGKHVIDQYFKGGAGSEAADSATMIGGDGRSRMQIRLLYDFKTNRVVTAYQPSGTIDDNLEIHADIMFMREHQEDIEQITFATGKSISEIENIYCGLRFNKWTLNNKSKEEGHATLSPLLSRYERDIFYVSFPYDVKASDIIGFGTYGQHWIIEYYDGAARAKEGFWVDSESFWKFVTPAMKDTFTLKAGTGYIVALDLDELYYISEGLHASIWDNTDITNLELLFPGKVSSISETSATYKMPEHTCTINRGTATGNRTIKDSHWNVLGVPTFKNITGVASGEPDEGIGSGALVFANKAWVKDSLKLKFIYDGNLADNSLSPKAVKGFEFKAMHAYVVQYCGNVTFTTSATPAPSPIVARRTYAEKPIDVDFRLELTKDGVMEDQTFISLSNDENTSADFEFGEDLSKEFNTNRANIYTFIGTEWVAGNTLPMSEQTTVVPVGVKTAADGDYTFAMPEGTSGVGVTLVDTETGIRTSLSALEYTVNLEAGTYDNRFYLEISPIAETPTNIEAISDQNSAVRKVMIDGILYIVKGNRIYDATGALVK